MAEFAVPFPTVVIAAILGVDPARRADFRRWSEHMVLAVFEPTTPEQRDAVMASGEEMGEYFDEVFAERTGQPGRRHGLVAACAPSSRAERCHARRARRVRVDVARRGQHHDRVPHRQRRHAARAGTRVRGRSARRPGRSSSAFVEETLRHESPMQMMFRTATADVEHRRHHRSRRAQRCCRCSGSANRDERVFADPDAFDYRRRAERNPRRSATACTTASARRSPVSRRRSRSRSSSAPTDVLEPAGTMERITSLVFRGPTSSRCDSAEQVG